MCSILVFTKLNFLFFIHLVITVENQKVYVAYVVKRLSAFETVQREPSTEDYNLLTETTRYENVQTRLRRPYRRDNVILDQSFK